MILRHESVQVVNETLARVLRILVILPDVNRFHRTDFLAHAAEDAAELIDLVHDRVAVALVVLTGNELDAVGRADRWAEAAGHTLRAAVRVLLHAMRATPARRELRLLV